MPSIQLAIPEDHISITRPIVYGVAQDLIKRTGMPEDTLIQYPGYQSTIPQAGSAMSDAANTPVLLGYMDRVWIESEETIPDNKRINYSVHLPENRPIFMDKDLGVYVRPIYQGMTLKLTFRLRTMDRASAIRWYNSMQIAIDKVRHTFLHTVIYRYPVPNAVFELFKEIHKLREAQNPLNETIGKWLNRCYVKNLVLLGDRSKGNQMFGIEEIQQRIEGIFEFGQTTPKPVRQDTGGDAFEVEFSYVFDYDKVIGVVADYPLMVHNQLLSDRFRMDTYYRGPDEVAQKASLSVGVLNRLVNERNDVPTYTGFSIPADDTWYPWIVGNTSRQLLRLLIQFDPNNPQDLLSLENDIRPYVFDADTLDYIKSCGDYIFKPYGSVFGVDLYAGQDMMDPSKLTIDSNLYVRYMGNLDRTMNHRVILTMSYAPLAMPPEARLNLQLHGLFFRRYVAAVAPSYQEQYGLIPLEDDGSVPLDDFDRALRFIATKYRTATFSDADQRFICYFLIQTTKQES